jgi:mannosyltransferase OCH1-like enzyme
MIPKIAHIVWLGGPMPNRETEFLNTTTKILDGYIINLWGNENIDSLITGHPIESFVRRAIENRKYAFASDAIKLIALQRFGGWSMDSDNAVYKSLSPYECHSWVTGFEMYNSRYAPFTAIWGSHSDHPFTDLLINKYKENTYEWLTSIPNTRWISQILINMGIKNDNTLQTTSEYEVTIYPSSVFCGPWEEQNTVAMHHFTGSWLHKS